jgi:hypothetical protein
VHLRQLLKQKLGFTVNSIIIFKKTMKLYQKIIIVLVVSLITILGGIVNWVNQFLIVGVAFFVSIIAKSKCTLF